MTKTKEIDLSSINLERQRRLQEIVDDLEDETDPSSVDRVLEYLEELQEEDEEFMLLLTENLKFETIYWELPWYQSDLRIGCKNGDHIKMNVTSDDPFRTDMICTDEHEIIKKNWRKFRKKYRLPNKLTSLVRWQNHGKSRNYKCNPIEQAKRFAMSYLSRGLQRTSYQVCRFLSSHYAYPLRGPFSAVEEKIISIWNKNRPPNTGKMLAIILGREVRGINYRLEALNHGKIRDSVAGKRRKWNLELATKLLNLILKYSGQPLEELKNKRFDVHVWEKVASEMELNYYYPLQDFWLRYLHAQIFIKQNIKLKKLCKSILKRLRDTDSYKVWRDIRWKDVATYYPDGSTPRFLYRLCYEVVKKHKPLSKLPLKQLMEFGLQKLKRMRFNKRLRTLEFCNGQLREVSYNS